MPERLIVIGGDAAGMSAASQAKRLRGDELSVIGFERGEHSSYSACGIPYWIAGDVQDEELLFGRRRSIGVTESICACAPRSSRSTWTLAGSWFGT
jgi:NADPH-dependent 2,4-dienoyl-CoA reductase/sulfur reductase-like enzyme